MIVDVHVHVGYPEMLSSALSSFMNGKEGAIGRMSKWMSPEGVIRAMDAAGVDHSVIFPMGLPPYAKDLQKLNEMTAEYVRLYPNRFTGFAVINPLDIKGSVKELERSVDELGLRGIKMHPTMQEFYPNDSSIFPVYEFIQDRGLPILCHTGASVPTKTDKYSQPLFLDEVAANFPELRLIMAHGGRPWYTDAALVLRKHPNVYVDIAANIGRTGGSSLLQIMLLMFKIYADALKRVLLASDYPVYTAEIMIQQLRDASENSLADRLGFPGITPEELDGMLGDNAARLLGLRGDN